jgi:hypothetical protein
MTRTRRSSPALGLGRLAAGAILLAACGRRNPPRTPDLVDLLNAYRRVAQVSALSKEPTLRRAAGAHAAEMARLGYFGHFSPVPENRSPDDRLAQQGWPPGRPYHELLALADTAEIALVSWQNKPANDRALLDPDLDRVGFAHDGLCWVLLLGEGATPAKQNAPSTVTDR